MIDLEEERELIPKDQPAGLVIYDDQPNYWDAWDTEFFHLQTRRTIDFTSVSIEEESGLRASLLLEAKYKDSTIRMVFSLDAVPASLNADVRSMLRVNAKVDWHAKHKFLKFELPLNIYAQDAIYETQWGTVNRPTHRNTSWDAAKFEVCGHKFADLSEYGYGVAILTESKYGYATEGNVMRLSLLRSATAPDANQDQGHHAFAFAILPHKGHFLETDVPHVAWAFNVPLSLRYTTEATRPSGFPRPIFAEGAKNIILDTIKRGEDDDHTQHKNQTVIVRFYEAFGGHGKTVLKTTLPVKKVTHVNILEDDLENLEFSTSDKSDDHVTSIKLSFRGFEVKTVKLWLESEDGSDSRRTSSDSQEWTEI